MDSLAERDAAEGIGRDLRSLRAVLDELRLSGDDLVLVVDRLQDPGNLGTLIRTADAVGAAAVALVEPCVDPFDPKTVRGSMGSIFHMPLVRSSGRAGAAVQLAGQRAAGGRRRCPDRCGLGRRVCGRAALRSFWATKRVGISPDLRPEVDAWARLPIAGRAESLNVAVAGGVLMYAWLRENGDE